MEDRQQNASTTHARSPSEISWPWALLVIAAIVAGSWLLHRGAAPAAKRTEQTVADRLKQCSPFQSFDQSRALAFEVGDHSVELTEAVGTERAAGALLADHPKIMRGTWQAVEQSKQVIVKIDAVESTYILVVPPSEDQCILSDGGIRATDLRTSWFGTPDSDLDPADFR